jgi:hypothetical protein
VQMPGPPPTPPRRDCRYDDVPRRVGPAEHDVRRFLSVASPSYCPLHSRIPLLPLPAPVGLLWSTNPWTRQSLLLGHSILTPQPNTGPDPPSTPPPPRPLPTFHPPHRARHSPAQRLHLKAVPHHGRTRICCSVRRFVCCAGRQ